MAHLIPQPHLYRCPDGEIFSVNGHKCAPESESHTCQPSEIPPPDNVPVGRHILLLQMQGLTHDGGQQNNFDQEVLLHFRWTSSIQPLFWDRGVFTPCSSFHGCFHLSRFLFTMASFNIIVIAITIASLVQTRTFNSTIFVIISIITKNRIIVLTIFVELLRLLPKAFL